MTPSLAAAWVEALGLEARLPDTRFLEDLFHVFQRRIAYETLTRPAGEPAAFDAAAFAAEWPEAERGLTGEDRAHAFAWLAGELGFECTLEDSLCSRPWARAARDEMRPGAGDGGFSSKVNGPEAHRSVVAMVSGRRLLADAGFPLPFLVPLQLPFEGIPCSFGTLGVEPPREGDGAGAGLRVTCDARGEVTDLLRFDPMPRPPASPPPREGIHRPPPDASPLPEAAGAGARAPAALRVLDDRVLYWEGGVMTVLDAWSVLAYPLAGTERAAFEALFALNLEGVDLPEVPAAEFAPALTVFHTAPLSPEDVRRGLAGVEPAPSDLVAPPEASIEAVPGGSRIARRARFLGAVPPAGPGESVRRTLVFHLAMDLLRLGESRPG